MGTIRVGDVIGRRYEVQRRAAFGGDATAYRATNLQLRQDVWLLPFGDDVEATRARLSRYGRINHAGLARLLRAIEHNGEWFAVFEPLERFEHHLEPSAHDLLGLAAGVRALHHAGLIHCALSRTLVFKRDDGQAVLMPAPHRLSDLSIAKSVADARRVDVGSFSELVKTMAPFARSSLFPAAQDAMVDWSSHLSMRLQPKRRVLIVDDDADTLALMQLCAEAALGECEVRVAAGGEEALEIMNSFDPEQVILDLDMPGINGMELAALWAPDHHKEVIVVTGRGSADDWKLLRSLGVKDVIPKPVEPAALVARLEANIERVSVALGDAL